MLMDSHLFHCGGSNISRRRRRLLYFTLHIPGNLPVGERAFSMFPRYRVLRLAEYEGWQEINAQEVADHHCDFQMISQTIATRAKS